jgi:hypothetical protein
LKRTLLPLLLASLSLSSARCADDPVSTTGGFARVHITVEGTILTGEGDAVNRAVIQILVFKPGCEGSALTVISGLSPDSSGRFQETFWMISDPSLTVAACLKVVATPLAETGLGAGSVTIDNVLFVTESQPPSTIEVDITVS